MERSFAAKATCLYLALIALAILSLGKLFFIQSAQGDDFRQHLADMWKRTYPLQARRGRIIARDGETVLADNVKLARIIVERHLVRKPEETAAKLSAHVGLSPEAILACITDDKSPRSLELVQDLPVGAAEQISQLRLPGVFIRYYYQRYYSYGNAFAPQTIGYACQKSGLQIGLEAQYAETLQGTDNEASYYADQRGRILPETLGKEQAHHGDDIVTTLDPAIQQISEDVLDRTYSRYRAKWGLIAVMDPNTGEMLAVAARPAFDPNDYARHGSKGHEANPLVHFVYEPGSIMKPLVAAAALDRGWLNPEETFHCSPTLTIGKYTITEAEHDRNPAGYGDIPIENIIVHSSNVGMAQVGLRLGQNKLSDIFATLGLYERTGIELPAEAKGLRPQGYDHAKKGEVWPEVVVATAAFGQGIAITPLQLMRAYAAIANGGYLVRPTLVKGTNDSPELVEVGGQALQLLEGESLVNEDLSRPVARRELSAGAVRVLQENTAHNLQAVMQRVVAEGTGKKAALDNFNVAGKTGTGQVAGNDGYAKGKYISSFIGFFPASAPRYLVLVIIAEPRGAYYASVVAAPAFREVAERIAVVAEVPPERKHEVR